MLEEAGVWGDHLASLVLYPAVDIRWTLATWMGSQVALECFQEGLQVGKPNHSPDLGTHRHASALKS